MWVIDIKLCLNESQNGPAAPELANKVEKLKELIVYASTRESFAPAQSIPTCDQEPESGPCNGHLNVHMISDDEIYWVCALCGDEGVVYGWKDLFWNIKNDDLGGEMH